MNIYHFGNTDSPALLLLPGCFTHWKTNFGQIIPYLEKTYHTMAASYDGFDENSGTVFTTVDNQREKIEKYVQENMGGHIHRIYGSFEGGKLAGLIAQRGKITFDAIILGSPRLTQSTPLFAKGKAKSAAEKAYAAFQKGENREIMANFPTGADMKFVTQESLYNQAYSMLITPLEKKIFPKSGEIHIIYTGKMGGVYQQRYNRHFADPKIAGFDFDPEEMLYNYPKQLSIVLRRMTKDLKPARETGK